MSSTVQILLLDDIDGSPADETVEFAIDGANFEIDLSKRNALALRQMLARYIKSARRVSGSPRSTARSATPVARRNGRVTAAPSTSRTASGNGQGRQKPAGRGTTSRATSARTTTRGAGKAGARVGAKSRTQVKARTTKRSTQKPAQVRQWARSQGISVSERGRISAELISKFQDAVR